MVCYERRARRPHTRPFAFEGLNASTGDGAPETSGEWEPGGGPADRGGSGFAAAGRNLGRRPVGTPPHRKEVVDDKYDRWPALAGDVPAKRRHQRTEPCWEQTISAPQGSAFLRSAPRPSSRHCLFSMPDTRRIQGHLPPDRGYRTMELADSQGPCARDGRGPGREFLMQQADGAHVNPRMSRQS